MGSYEFAEYFRKNGIFCGRTEAFAPTVFLESFGKFVGVDAHIDPREVANSPRISVKSGLFAGTMWASSPTHNRKISEFLKNYFFVRRFNSAVIMIMTAMTRKMASMPFPM